MNAIYVGNCLDYLDCDLLIKSVSSKQGSRRDGNTPFANRKLFEHPTLSHEVEKIGQVWKDAGYLENDSIEYFIFYPDEHFDQTFIDVLSEKLNARACHAWICSIKPGKCVPWHWDIELKEDEYKKMGNLVRYSIFIDKPQIGKVFVLNDTCFHMIKQGSIYKWTNWKEHHLGFNCGTTEKYLLHFMGVE